MGDDAGNDITLVNEQGGRFIAQTTGVQVGASGPFLKNSSEVLHIRNTADSAFANIEAANGTFNGHITSAFQSLPADPTTLDVPSGLNRLVKNTTSGEIRSWVNDAGVMKKSPAYV